MKKIFKRAMALILVAVMTFTAVPLSGFEAKASGLTGYSAGAAAKWGRDHINDVWSPLLGYGIWENGGDCANYVSQCLYMGGLDMTGAWHSNGCMRYYAALSDGVFIRAQQLHDYLVSIGGQSIRNPSADQLSLGDVLFFKRSGAARCTHSAIVIDFENGQPVIGYHSILNKAGVYEIGRTTDIDLDFMRENTYLVKLNGSICTAQKSRDFDVYIANKSTGLYSSAGGYGFIRNVIGSDYIHVYSTQYANGSTWGYTFCRGYWGWVKIADCNYQTHVSTPEVNHKFGGWYVAKPATCLTSGYEQRDCTVCGFSQQRTITGGHLVKEHATCLTPGFCSICGAAVEEALGHDFGDWSFITEPTCTESGVRTHICKRCGFEEQEEVAPLGHDDIHVSTPPSCTDIGTAMYECQRCGRTIANYINSENTVTDWTPEVIEGLKPVETKIQYSYRDKSFTSSYGTGIDGWTQYSYEWVQSGSGDAQYVNSWPSGWHTDDWHYQNFRVGPFSPYETEIAKREVVNKHIGYLNAHWCRGNDNSSSSKNTLISQYYTAEFWKFHAFGSYDNKATSITENAYKYDDGYYCNATYWWHANLQTPYYSSRYTDYNKLFHYYKWSDWSEWTDEEISASDTREVQTRTVYKYNLAALGHDFSVVDSQKDPTCTEPGYIGKSCSRCGAISPDAEIIPAPGHELYEEISEHGWYKTSEENGIITWRRDCQRFCGYYEEKQENGDCVFELKEIIESTCEEDGKIISVCKYHNEEKTEIIKAKGHEPDNNWITEYSPTCANGGKEGREICYCVRYDNGVTCNKVFERPIPAPDHVVVKDPPVSPTCTETGYKEGSHCDVCKETLIERPVDPALGHEPDNNWIVVEEPGCDKDGKEICYCVRHDDGVTCDKIFDRPIPGIPATYKEIKRVESSCAECGYIEYTCINCEDTENEHGYTEPLPLDPNGHAEGVWKTLQEAQICEIPGIEVSECPLCGEMLDKKEIPPQYEKHNMVKEVIKSSCTTSGITNEYCTQCGLTLDPVDDDPLGHDLGDWVVEKEATCTEHGEKRQYCQRDGCSYYITEPITPIGHDYKVSQVIAPLCEEIGKTIYVCQNDSSHTFEGDFVPALGHEPDGNWIVTKEPDCTNKGTEQCDCVRHDDGVTCDTVFIRDIEINPDAHDWGDWFVNADPNCVDKGIEKRICNINNEHIQTKETVTDPDNHDMGEWYEVTKATCTEKGLEKRDCNRCDYYEERETAIDPDNHYAETFYTVDEKADCENDGKKSHHCERCDKSLDEVVISKRNHVYDDGVETTAPTCTEDGVKTFTCTNEETNEYKACTHSYTEVIPATGHAWDEGVIDPDSTCKVHGTKTYTCQNDTSHTKTEEVPLDENNHVGKTYIKDNKDATCTEDGYTGDIYCSDCDKKLEDGKVIPALGHDMGEWYEVTKATCTEKGLEKRDCNRCDYSEERETAIDPDNHYAETFYTVDEKADCEKDGKKSHHCERCDKSLDEVVISKRNHVYDNGVETKAPTCTEDGVMTFTCTNEETNEYKACTHSYTEVIPATDHDWGNWETVTPATCEADGLEKRICKNDASHVEENVLTAIGHKWDDGVIDPDSTCNVHGTKTYTCQNDASHTKTEEVPLDENNHVGDTYTKDNKDATCTEDGYTGDIYCSDCDKKLESGEVIPATGHTWGEWETVKESSYTENGEEKRVCSKGDAEETRPLPVLTRPSDDNDNIETEKTVEYDSATGEAVIKLVASSKGEKITVNSRTPLDIVLVLDQSGSMEGNLLKKLKTATEDFTNAIYQDAVNNNIDHRIAMVGFAMQNASGKDYPQYLNTEILSTGGAPVQYNSLSTAKMNEVYRNALVSVNVDGTLNPVLTLAKNNLEAKGATAADLGLDMACKVFAQNENDGSRKRIVVFMTDGVPTYTSSYDSTTATNATTKANLLKDAYEADLYSVGVLPSNVDKRAKTFLTNVASKDENNKALYFDCADADKLVEDFQTIATQSTTVTTDFADITLIDTVSSAFTLTAVQENELRKNAIEKLGITNDDITVTRYADGTTEVKLEHINPVAIADGDDINYVIDIDFRVTANEKALIAGSYGTNTDNAGVLIGTTDVYENNFAVPGATVENAEGVIYFTVNGITYHMVRVHKGDTPEAPEFTLDGEYTFSGWDIPDEVVFDGGKLTVDATLTQKEYTVTWNTADGTMTDSYYAGDVIVVPEVGLNAKGDEVIGWNTVVPVTMPAENLEFTAIYGKHVHSYTENVLKKVSCGVEGKVQYICICGDSYTETLEPLTHKWVTSATSSDGTDTAYSHVYCENCGESPDKTLQYTIKGTTNWNKQVTYDLKLTDAENITVQPDGEITISLPVPQNMKNARNITIYREEADGTLTNLNGTVKNGYITFTTTHFSIYIIEAEYECAETGNHTDEDADKICDICGNEIPVEEPSENCNHYCHQKGFMNFLWKIFNFLYRLFGMEAKRICECGAAHW